MGLIPGSGRSPEVGYGKSLQYSCLENFMDRGAWQAAHSGVTKSQTHMLAHTHTHTHTLQLYSVKENTLFFREIPKYL